ncbi:IclR family transcriptional regulator domain-containing protein [Corynebacterium sp. TAE3-ERU16]|uniref:IclR family transcriptional regulator domain-containing protein n=1 Tax=Corynebacterium sp. TAE3-ERU16 TaxID=2849493 RepID=UPI001C4367D3|nr:IclR family transcriptional regulator C-terminal domain-containing protein [Corynebacterium sp. TAE3-ERU16]MBV7292949.1 helix-turn-helix domain-containing protein [Corynebacterium sp. TAE3-ERU16]
MSESARSTDHVQSLARGLQVLCSFSTESSRQTLSEVARATGLTRATARRFLLTLKDLGYADGDGSRFWLTPKCLELGYSYLSTQPLTAVAQPHLEQLRTTTGESASMAVLDGADIVYVSRVAVSRIMTVGISIGTRFPAHLTSMGRVLLAGLREEELDDLIAEMNFTRLTRYSIGDAAELKRELGDVRKRDFAVVSSELEIGLTSLAVPVHDPTGAVVAAINTSTQTAQYTLPQLSSDLLPHLREAAGRIEADLRVATSST